MKKHSDTFWWEATPLRYGGKLALYLRTIIPIASYQGSAMNSQKGVDNTYNLALPSDYFSYSLLILQVP